MPRQFCELTSEHASSHQNNIKDIDRAAVAIRCLEPFTTNRWLGRLLPRIETTMTVSVLTLPASQETGMTTMRTTNSVRRRRRTGIHGRSSSLRHAQSPLRLPTSQRTMGRGRGNVLSPADATIGPREAPKDLTKHTTINRDVGGGIRDGKRQNTCNNQPE